MPVTSVLRNRLLILFALAALAGCSSTVGPDIRDEMVGMNEEQLNRCMGPPARDRAEGQTKVLSYYADSGSQAAAAEASLPLLPTSEPQDVGSHTCQIVIKLERGKVMTVDYESLIPDRNDHECADTIQRCAR